MHIGSDRERLYLEVAKACPTGQRALTVARQTTTRLVRVHRPSIIGLARELLAIATGDGVTVEGDALAALLDADGSEILRLGIKQKVATA